MALAESGADANAETDEYMTRPGAAGASGFIGPYRILETLGEGGMGVVYLADQAAPLQRRVALKLIKLGMDTREVVARFEAERQALALMDHPNIASVFDAGTTEDGRPYFVMEYVPGVSITTYCDAHRLSTTERLELFTEVCGAIQHAHQKGVIHRDLKPSNVIVMVQDGRPVPKVIDFGVAKATRQRLTEKTLFTQHGLLIGTPEYMSPEQAEMSAIDVDATTDIYSLGMLLYELLVGELPFESTRLRQAGYAEIQRIIREEEPARPSAKLTSLGAKAGDVASRHHTSVRMLARELKGDLDWITLHALEKDRTRRYASASELAADIARHLADEPVMARPPSMAYRLEKLARRRRGAVAAAGLIAAVTIAGFVTSTALYLRSEAARQETDRQRLDAQRRAYVANMTLAAVSLDAVDPAAARRYLNLTDPELRGWEWRHLHLRADPGLATLHAYGPFANFPGLTSSFSFSEDGRQMFWNTEGTVHVWDTSSYRQTAVYGGFGGSMLALAPGARYVVMRAVTETDYALRLIDPISGGAVATLTGLDSEAACATFSRDGTRVAAGSESAIRIWDTSTGRLIATLAGGDPVCQVRFSPDGRRLASATRDAVTIWDLASGRGSRIVQEGAWAVAFSPDGTRLASADVGTIRIWELSASRSPLVLEGHSGRIWALAFSPDGTRLASASEDRSVRLWDVQSHVATAILPASISQGMSSLAFDPTGQRLFAAEHAINAANIKVWDVVSPEGFSILAATEKVIVGAFSPEADLLAVSNEGGSVSVWNVGARQVQATLRDAAGKISWPVFDPRGGRLGGAIGTTARIWDLATGRPLVTMAGHTQDLSSVAFSPAGTEVITTSPDKTARVWDAVSGRALAKLEVAEQVNAAVFTADGAFAIVGSGDPGLGQAPGSHRQTVHRWDWRADKVTASIDGRDGGAVMSVAISPDGRRIVLSGSSQLMAHVWDDRLETRICVTTHQSDPIDQVFFTADSRRVVGTLWDGTVRVWDAETGDSLLVLRHGNRRAVGLAVSPDSSRIATSDARRIYLWESRSQQELKASALVESLFKELALAGDVVAHLERDRTLAPDVREVALRLAQRATDDPQALNERAWKTVRTPGAGAEASRAALRLAEAARRTAPWTTTHVTTIGLAQYRIGDYQQSIATLESDGKPATATRSTILAMARFKIGQIDQARALLEKARTTLGARKPSADLTALMTEAERLLAGR